MSVYAVIHTGGKQYRVSPGDVIRVEKVDAETGSSIEIDRVFLLSADGQVRTGTPLLEGARVVAKVLDQGRGDKIIVFKKRRRKGYYKTTGHRQYLTSLRITEIVLGGASYKAEEVKKPQPKAVPAPKPAAAKTPEPERKKPAKAPAIVPKEQAVKKPEAAKPPTPPITEETKEAPAAAQAVALQPSPAVGAKKYPDQASQRPEAVPAKTVETPSAQPQEPATPVREQPEPAVPEPLISSAEPSPAAVRPGIVTTRPVVEHVDDRVTENRKRWRLYAALAGALALLVLLLLLLLGGPRQAPLPGKQAETPAGRTTPGAVRGGEQPRAKKPPVQDRKIRETAPVQKPVAPAQPPD
jgi:large subunit ribosomal protein L21